MKIEPEKYVGCCQLWASRGIEHSANCKAWNGQRCIDCNRPVMNGNICLPCVRVRYPSKEDRNP